jgi:hypothetical protein
MGDIVLGEEVSYLCGMEKNYLYPGDSVKPIEVGEVYRDYLFSDILSANGIAFIRGIMHYGREKTEMIDGYPRIKSYCLALIETDKGKVFIAPLSRFKPVELVDFPPLPFQNVFPGHEFIDLRVRYYIGSEVLRPVWISAKCKDGEELVKGEDGHWRHMPKYEDRYSVFSRYQYCTELITGPLFEFGDMPLGNDGYLGFVHSDYLVTLE